MGFLIKLLAYAAGVAAASWLLDGIRFTGPSNGSAELQEKVLPLLGVALILALVNTFIRPILNVLSLPITILTLGLFLLVVNGLMLWLASRIADYFDLGFRVTGFWPAVIGAMVITVVGWVVDAAVGDE
ncbi:phage holin family protein [Nocardioides sp.]|uniref:phage holin family protein n=1 Tax=Nocardioides sp. TaxID=35761 RepID=UPI00286E847A|nr:phage holin family protein [Nocardioides sp.]